MAGGGVGGGGGQCLRRLVRCHVRQGSLYQLPTIEMMRWGGLIAGLCWQGVKRLLRSRFLVAATGALVEPSLPDVPGAEGFRGPSLHTARWDDGVKLEVGGGRGVRGSAMALGV